ncbi:MAG: DUF3568 domain-containing protein [Lentisphaeraceae bacterium]|nr:DUF3568 domain-containing protein [Lentisphaeraceae bacterium]
MINSFSKVFILATMLMLTSCSFFQSSIHPSGATYQYGKLEGVLSKDLKKSTDAAKKTVKALEFMQKDFRKDAFNSIFILKNAKNQEIEINLSKLTKDKTKVSIKVGLIGDEFLSQQILEDLKSNL